MTTDNKKARVAKLETRRKPADDLQTRLQVLRRQCARVPASVAVELRRQFLYRCTDDELLALAGLPQDASMTEIEAVARGR